MLNTGDIAPKFNTQDIWGNQVSSSKTNKWVYLSFHRFAACPFCNLRTNELINAYDKFLLLDIEILSIWPSKTENMLRYIGNKISPFPLISDPGKKIFEQYAVCNSSKKAALRLLFHPKLIFNAMKNKYKNMEVDADPNLMPAGFLIDPSGEVKLAYYGKHFGDHIAIDRIFQQVKL